MGTYPGSTSSSRRQPRRRATLGAITVLAVAGLVSACTAASAGAVKSQRAPDRYPAGAAAPIQVTTSDETQQSLRQEHFGKRLPLVLVSGGPSAASEYEALRAEHQPGTK